MEAAEIGVRLRVDAIVDLTGTTSRDLLVQGPSDLAFRALPMTIDTPPNFAIRNTLDTDFPVAGNYHIQLRAIFADGRDLTSKAILLNVREALKLGLC